LCLLAFSASALISHSGTHKYALLGVHGHSMMDSSCSSGKHRACDVWDEQLRRFGLTFNRHSQPTLVSTVIAIPYREKYSPVCSAASCKDD
jgi:hypothetical protein